jgi:hypothetical protein
VFDVRGRIAPTAGGSAEHRFAHPIGYATHEHDQGNPRLDYVGVYPTVPDYQIEAAPRRIVDIR